MKQPLHESRRSLWSFPEMRLVLAGRTVSYAGDAVALVALTLRDSADGNPGAVTALLLAFALPTVLMIPVAGGIVDRYDSRAVLVAASLTQAVAGVGVALSSLAMLAGSAAGGVLVGWFGDRTALLADAATFAALAVVGMLVRTRRRLEPGVREERGGMLEGFRVVFTDDLLRVLVPGLWVFIIAAEASNVVEVHGDG